MNDRFEFDLVSNRPSFSSTTSSKSRRSYSQRNVSTLQHELNKTRKMINVKTSMNTVLNRTLSFKPIPISSPSLANVENTPIKIIPTIKEFSYDCNSSNENNEVIEETPIKENEICPSDLMAREIQRLSLRLRSSTPLYNVPVIENKSSKPVTLHLSQVVNRVSRCNYVLRRFVREAQKYSPKHEEKRPTSQPIPSKIFISSQSHEKGRRRLFIDSPQQKSSDIISDSQPVTPRKASGVIKQLFSSPSSSLKRTHPSPNHHHHEKRPRLF